MDIEIIRQECAEATVEFQRPPAQVRHTVSPRVTHRQGQPRPPVPHDGPSRGAMLRWWLDEHAVSVGAFAKLCGVSASTVSAWINGGSAGTGYDLLGMREKKVRALLDGLRAVDPSITSAELHALLNVPPELESLWSFFSPAEETQFVLATTGRVSLSHPAKVRYRPGVKAGLQIAQNGNEWRIDELGDLGTNWHALGQVLNIEF